MSCPGRIAAILFAPLLLAAAPTGPVHVGTPDTRAQFQEAGDHFVPDGPCRAVLTAALATLPDCTRDLANGSPSAALFVAVAYSQKQNPNFAPEKALATLQASILRTPHPALRYLLGSMLMTGETLPPRYEEARAQLELATAGGNSAAADLLGTLWLEGKGGPQDVSKAAVLFEQALAGGFSPSLGNLANLYLTGRRMPPNLARMDALIAAAQTAGDPNATKLKEQIAFSAKITNFQTIPPLKGDVPASIAYHGFEGPELPQSVGFDAAFQKIYYAPFDGPVILADLRARAATMPTPFLFELARRTAPSDPREAMTLYLLARLRMGYDGARCADPTAAQGAAIWGQLIVPQIRYGDFDQSILPTLAADALAREAKMPGDTVPRWICYHGITANEAALAGRPYLALTRPAAEWPAIRAAERARFTAAMIPQPK